MEIKAKAELATLIHGAIYQHRDRLDTFCDVTVKVQDGKPVLVEILTKHKPSDNTWVNRHLWESCACSKPTGGDLAKRVCYGGLYVTKRAVAFVLFYPQATGNRMAYIQPHFWLTNDLAPAGSIYEASIFQGRANPCGSEILTDVVTNEIAQLCQERHVSLVGVNPWNSAHLAGGLADAGVHVAEVRDGFQTMNQPMRELQGLIEDGRLEHDGNLVMGEMVNNLPVVTDVAGNMKPASVRDLTRVSGAIALVNAVAVSLMNGNK